MDAWRALSVALGFPPPIIDRSPAPDPRTVRDVATPQGPAGVWRLTDGWGIRYPDGLAYDVRLADGLRFRIPPAHQPEAPAHFTRLAGPLTALAVATAGCYPLHAAGLDTPSGTVAVVASSGGGKSTVAALAARHGWPVRGDDLLALDGSARVLPLPGSLRVAPELAPPDWSPRLVLPDGRGWYDLPAREPTPLRAVFLLGRGTVVHCEDLRGVARLSGMVDAGFVSWLETEPAPAWHDLVGGLTSTVPLRRLIVPEGLRELSDAWEEIARCLAAAAR